MGNYGKVQLLEEDEDAVEETHPLPNCEPCWHRYCTEPARHYYHCKNPECSILKDANGHEIPRENQPGKVIMFMLCPEHVNLGCPKCDDGNYSIISMSSRDDDSGSVISDRWIEGGSDGDDGGFPGMIRMYKPIKMPTEIIAYLERSTDPKIKASGGCDGTVVIDRGQNVGIWHVYSPYARFDKRDLSLGLFMPGMGKVPSDYCIRATDVVWSNYVTRNRALAVAWSEKYDGQMPYLRLIKNVR